jgi:hypothetical protein
MPWALDVLSWLHALLWAYFAALAGLAVIALALTLLAGVSCDSRPIGGLAGNAGSESRGGVPD